MRTKQFAFLSDLVLVALVVVGAVYLLAIGTNPTGATTDRPLLPLSVDGSRILLIVATVGVVLGLAVSRLRMRRARIENGMVTRYSLYDRVVHWAIAIGFV